MPGIDHRHTGRNSRKDEHHSGNGLELINESVLGLFKKLRIEQPKSRPRKSNGNGLVESKKQSSDPQTHRVRLGRPCGQAEVRAAGTIACFAAGSTLYGVRAQHPDIDPVRPGACGKQNRKLFLGFPQARGSA